jgi:hypothetical protein
MTYDQTRDSEQLSYLDDAIAEFISRYNFNVQSTGRRTIIFFPGGMGSRLLRATTPEPDGPPFFTIRYGSMAPLHLVLHRTCGC